jgi:glycosyltransferase involved in cell wall biosynthesis
MKKIDDSTDPIVLILTHCFAPNVGGVETHLTDLTRHMNERRVRTTVITYQPIVTRAIGPFIEHRGTVTIIRIPWIGFGLFNVLEPYPLLQFAYLFPVLFLASLLYVATRQTEIRTINAHGMVCSVIARLLKMLFAELRVVVCIHAVYGWLYDLSSNGILPRFLRWTLGGVDLTLSLARASRKEIIGLGVPPERTGTFTYWVNQNIFRPMPRSECRRSLGWPDRFCVLFVGRLIPAKGISVLLDVASRLKNIQFIFAGDGPMKDTVAEAARMKNNIIFAGRVNNSDLPLCYNATDLLCVPSQYDEGFGRIILEALSCGCPVIASNKGGIPEAMDNSVGILTEPTVDRLVQDIMQLHDDNEQLECLRRRCVAFARERYSTRNADRILESFLLPPAPFTK